MTEPLLSNDGQPLAPESAGAGDMPLVGILRTIPHFAAVLDGVEPAVLQQIEPLLSYFGVAAGTVLFREEEPAEDAYVLVGGRVGVFVAGQDTASERPLAQIGAGEIFGEMGLISGEPRSATVVALRDSDVVRVPRAAFGLVVQSSPEASLLLMRYLVTRLRETSHVHAAEPSPEAIAVVRLTAGEAEKRFADALVEALAEAKSAIVIDAVENERRQPGAGPVNPLSVYIAADPASAWTRHSIRQADRVIFIAQPDRAGLAAGHPAIADAAALHRAADLVLVNPVSRRLPSGGSQWLGAFHSDRILQVRDGNHGDVRRVARMALGRAIGLVLSGGGARGFAHVGVYRALCEAGIPVDLVGGTSMGAMVAALIALDLSPAEAAERLQAVFVSKNPVSDYTFPVIALSRGRKFNRLLRQHYGEGAIEDLWKGFFCVSANLSTGDAIAHASGTLWRALRASGAIPGIVPPVVENGQVLVDGGIMNNFPTEVMVARRAGLVLGVEVASGGSLNAAESAIEDRSALWLLRHGRKQMPSILRILMRCGTVNSELQSVASRAAADVLIQPELPGIDMLSFQAFEKAAESGYRAGAAAVSEIRRSLDKDAPVRDMVG